MYSFYYMWVLIDIKNDIYKIFKHLKILKKIIIYTITLFL